MSRKDILVRSIILAGVVVMSFILLMSAYERPGRLSDGGRLYPSQNVSLYVDGSFVVVKVDDREERVRIVEAEKSPIYQEALARIPHEDLPPLTSVRWRRVVRYLVIITALSWVVLFHLWQPLRPYTDGPLVR